MPTLHKEDRPWGNFERFTLNEKTTVKLITIKPNKRLSLQFHKNRSEFWYLIIGEAIADLGDKTISMKIGDQLLVPINTIHRLTGGDNGATILEIAFGEFDESDITRIKDDYQRAE